MDGEKKAFGKWWIWVLLLVIVSILALGATGFLTRFGSTVAERVIFENSFQRNAAEAERIQQLEAELVGINARLRGGDLSETQRNDLEAQRAAVEFQLNRSE